MRIGIFSECYKPTLNGVVVSIESFREALEKRGHEFFIFAPKSNSYRDANPSHVFRVSAISSTQNDYPLALPFLTPSISGRVRDLRLDLIHTQHLFAMGRLGLGLGRKLDIPVIHTYHTLITEYSHYVPLFPNFAKKVIKNLSRSYCNRCDQIVTPSPSMKRTLRSYGVKTPIEPIPTGVNLDDFNHPFHQQVLKAKWQIPEDKKILLYLSRIAKEKNLDFLFSTIKILAEKRRDFHLLLVGGGPELAHYQAKVSKIGLGNFVTFTDKQEKAIANRFFGAADIFVFPSITETQGIVITEAMAAGVPAVALDKMGPHDLIQSGLNGYLSPLKIKDFAGKIEKLLDNDGLRTKMGRRARMSAQKYSQSNSARQMEKLYERTINHRP